MNKKIRKFNMHLNINFKLKPLNLYQKNVEVLYKDIIHDKISEIIQYYKNQQKILKEKQLSIIDYEYKYAKIKEKKIQEYTSYMKAEIKDGNTITLIFEIKYILKRLKEIGQEQLITRSLILKEKIKNNINYDNAFENIIEEKNNEVKFTPIQYELIPEKINHNMFDQGNLGICYLVAAINSINQIPSVFEHIFIDKEYNNEKTEYKLNAFINGKLKEIILNDIFVYEKKNNKLKYFGSQTYKYELFMKFIEKLYAELNKDHAPINSFQNQLEKSVNMLKNIIGGFSNYLYRCLLGTSCIKYNISDSDEILYEKRVEKYIENIEKNINKEGIIMTTDAYKKDSDTGHEFAINNIFEYENHKGTKKKFIQIYNPWGSGNSGIGYFDFNEIQKESENYQYIHEFNENYNNSGQLKIPLNLFSKWFKNVEVCAPKYGFHYKVIENNIKKNENHFYLFKNNLIQTVEIELFLDELNNIEFLRTGDNINLSLSKIEGNNFIVVEKKNQKESIFFSRKNAYIIINNLSQGNYLITLSEFTNSLDKSYNLRIGGEFEFLNEINNDDFLELKNKYKTMKFLNINNNIFSQNYILLEKSFFDMKIFSVAKNIYNLMYDPYEKNTYSEKIQNTLKKIISLEIDAFNKKIYTFEKNNETGMSKIRYFYKNIIKKLKDDGCSLLKKSEDEIIKITKDLGDLSRNVKVILEKPDGTTREINLYKLKNIITGDFLRKQHFYGSIRGYTIIGNDIEEFDSNKKFEQSRLFQKIILDEMPKAFKNNKELLKNCDFFLPIITEEIDIEELIDNNLLDIVFVVDSTNSMKKYINGITEKCRDIIEEITNDNAINFSEKKYKFGAILYRDIVDQKDKCENILIPLTSQKDLLKEKLEKVETKYGGDDAEDWNGAYELLIENMNWTSDKSIKIVIHICDASTHGREFTSKKENDNHPEEGIKFIKTIEKVSKKGIKIIGFPIGERPVHCFQKFMEIYKGNNGYSFSNYVNIMPKHEDLDFEIFNQITIEALKFIIKHE